MSATAMGMGKMKRFMMGVAALAVVSGCASTSISRPADVSFNQLQTDSRFAANYRRIAALHTDFGKTADKLSRESRILNTLTVAGATATLAFTGFDAHADNIIASTLVTSVAGASATQLKPGNRAAFRVKGMLALSCIAAKADSLIALERLNEETLNATLAIGHASKIVVVDTQVDAFMKDNDANEEKGVSYSVAKLKEYTSSISAFDALNSQLFLVTGLARKVDSPSAELVAAITKADAARTKLALGIKAEREAFSTMSAAIDVVESAVYGEKPPSVAGLIDAISKVEFPAAPSAPTGSSSLSAAAGEDGGDTPSENDYIVALEFLTGQAELLAPEQSASLVKGMTACTASVAQ